MNLERLNNIVNKDQDSSTAGKVYDVVMFITIFASITPLMFDYDCTAFRYIEIISVSVFIADYIARWMVAPLNMGKGKKSILLYPFTPMAIVDLLSILPALNLLGGTFKLFRLTRMLRIVRTFKLFRFSNNMERLGRVLYKERMVLSSVLLMAVFYIFVTALVMYNVEPHVNTETGEPVFKSFFDALYWASVTLTTVGYGDVCPVTDIGRLISILSSIFGVAIIALPSGVVTASYLEELRKDQEEANK